MERKDAQFGLATMCIGLGQGIATVFERVARLPVLRLSFQPRQWEPSEETREVLDTCKVIAEAPRGSIAAYVISMAKTPSDVLAVHLLLKEAGIGFALPVAPLFETLDDLNNANDVMTQLLNIDWYRGFIQGKQMVMIGYSDSAKDGDRKSVV